MVLSRPSVRVAISTVLAAFASPSIIGPARVYIADPSRQRLALLFSELSRTSLATEVTLYHGSLIQFFREIPLSAALICTDIATAELSEFLAAVPPGAMILSPQKVSGDADSPVVRYLIENGILEIEAVSEGGAAYRATRRCSGRSFVPRIGLRVELQGKLHERYFLSEAEKDAGHTPVADLTEDIRREFSRSFPGASGLGPWPYSAPESAGLPSTLPSGNPWPRVSIVTPTRNQGRYLEQTILSILHQDYPNVEHIVVDGASTDETSSILARYQDKLAFIISEPDDGQSDAINKGMSKATGEILTWLNGDDMLAPGALASAALAFDVNSADMIAGICRLYRDGVLESQHLTSCADGPLPLEDLLDLDQGWNAGQFFVQPEVMFTREIWLRAGGRVNERLHYTMDYYLWLRFAHVGARWHVSGRPVAWFRLHEEQKISARSSVALELTACRDAFLSGNEPKRKSASTRIFQRQKLRIAVLHEGDSQDPNINHVRLARTLAWAGHAIKMVPIQDAPWRKRRWEGLLHRVSATGPDLVMVCDRNSLSTDSRLSHLLAKCFRTIVITGDTLAYGPSAETIRWSSPSDVFRPRNNQACREDLGLPMDRFLILLPSGWDGDRNETRALFAALERLELPNMAVVSVDPTTVHTSIEVIALGRIDDRTRSALLNSAVDIVLAPASAETLEQVCLEAIACGTPVAGYRLAAGPEAIRDGVTGLFASDNNPASIASAIHYLYVHPDLREDLSKWGPRYVENEWSEFSAYRQIFLALNRLGLVKSLKLRRQIEFLPGAPEVPVQLS